MSAARFVRWPGVLLALVVAAAPACARSHPHRHREHTVVAPAARAGGFGAAVGFQSEERLREHFRKHGGDVGAASASDYLRRAQALRDAPAGGDVLELRRADGVITRYDRSSGAFLAFDSDGTLRTYFRPNQGESYFRRQAARAGGM